MEFELDATTTQILGLIIEDIINAYGLSIWGDMPTDISIIDEKKAEQTIKKHFEAFWSEVFKKDKESLDG